MKKFKMKFNKNIVKKYVGCLIAYRKLFFALFFCVLLVFTSSIIYENVYCNMKNIDYAESGNFESDEMKKSIMFKKVIENVELRERVTRNVKNRNYRNPFGFNDEESLNENNDNDNNDNNENNNEEDGNDEESDNDSNNDSSNNDDNDKSNNDDDKDDNSVISPIELFVPLMH